jgi:hypothetical protein
MIRCFVVLVYTPVWQLFTLFGYRSFIEIPTTQIWDTKFQIGILDFKTLVSTWILVKNSNLEPWMIIYHIP